MQNATATTPVVFAIVYDATGFVKSLARPGGNLKTAEALGVRIPPSVLACAGQVIR